MGGLLKSKRTSTSLWPEVGHNYLCQEPVHRGKGTNTNLRVGLLLHLRSLLGASTLGGKGTPETGRTGTPNGVPFDHSLHGQTSVIILN
jgi:hypothetical protein